MKKLFILVFIIILGTAYGQNSATIQLSSGKDGLTLLDKSETGFKVINKINEISFSEAITSEGTFTLLNLHDFSKIYNTGKPELPNCTRLIELPQGATARVKVISYDEQTIDLPANGLNHAIIPAQPSYFKNTSPADIHFEYDRAFYSVNAYNEEPMASVKEGGTLRGTRTGKLLINPFSYNPVENKLKIYNNIVVQVDFDNANTAQTEQLKEKYYSPLFDAPLNRLLNYTAPLHKDLLSRYPIKYVIVSYPQFQDPLQPFVRWKTRKGFHVVEYYPTSPTTASIKTYLTNLYTSATPGNPAPTFVLFVGDVAQIPSNSGIDDPSTYTDLYFCTMDGSGDYVPDMYYGRFSATSLAELQPQIDKTLEYEQYLMPDPNYLDTVVMIAGVDNGSQPDGGYSQVYANGQINYGTSNYFNPAHHGLYSKTYLWPVTNNASTDIQIRSDIGKGVGYANYTAHGSVDGWADPQFNVSQVASMSNAHKYGLMIGNCCVTNTFSNSTACFGEALLRAVNKGAVGYIGASNNSLWDEDYYWGVGSRATIVENPVYQVSNLGAYDRVFHDHGEAATDWYVCNGQMIYGGNLAVQQSNSSSTQYYWEIYHLMGDPSVMNYMWKPDPLVVRYNSPINTGIDSIHVHTEPGAYVAISHNNVLLDAKIADAGGIAALIFTAFNLTDTADIVATMQNRAPYIGKLEITDVLLPLDVQANAIINPQTSYNCDNLDITPKITIRNRGASELTSVKIYYSFDNQTTNFFQWNGNLATYGTVDIDLPSIHLAAGSHTYLVFTSDPNGSIDGNNGNDTLRRTFTVNNLQLVSNFTADHTNACSSPLAVSFTNSSQNTQTYLWDFGDGNTSTDSNPVHTYSTLGNFCVSLVSYAGVCGSVTEIKPAYILVGADLPVAPSVTSCGTGSVTLNATGTGTIYWYNVPAGGSPIDTGNVFITPSIANTTDYYIENRTESPVRNIGKADSTGIGSYTTNQTGIQGLIFNSYVPFTIVSAYMYASAAGSRTIYLQDSLSNNISTYTINIPRGHSRVQLNISVPADNSLRLVAQAAPSLFRNGANNNAPVLPYPYQIQNLMSITKSTASGTNYNKFYYYFYNMEIQGQNCTSARDTVSAMIVSAAPAPDFTIATNALTVYFNNQTQNADSYLWRFGDGDSSVLENPSHTYTTYGTYNVTLMAGNACGNSDHQQSLTLTDVTGICNYNNELITSVYPNPTDGRLYIKLSHPLDRLVISDPLGRIIRSYENISQMLAVDLSGNSTGLYFLRAQSGNIVKTFKIILR